MKIRALLSHVPLFQFIGSLLQILVKRILLLFLVLWEVQAYGKDLGIYGSTFDIKEEDLLERIGTKLNTMQVSGELEKHQEHLQQRVIHTAQNPKPVSGVTRAIEDRQFFYDPSITVQEDLKTGEGRIFHKKGEKINPLDTVSLTQTLIFLDGSDTEQIDWAVDQLGNNKKYILIRGSPFKLMERFEVPFYFDQEGRLTGRLGIKHVPASVIQEGKKLKIQEHKI